MSRNPSYEFRASEEGPDNPRPSGPVAFLWLVIVSVVFGFLAAHPK